uniref:Ribosomal protein L16 n=1 Tax=Tryblionella apiculata TaxID=1003145 RepID=A0A8F1B7J9_9STRA|nr:ribosomal protein L16 [Tryblionella apiculata]QWM93612.1 ribosomal protein L16 [Tryblionella apiculata]
MFLQPRKTKYRKTRKGKLKNLEFKANTIRFGELGLKAESAGMITARQIEAARRAIARKIKRKGKIWICIFPDLPITAKPIESRMGKGKGSVSHWVARVRGGSTLFEVCGIPTHIAIEALRSGSKKLPIKTKIFD